MSVYVVLLQLRFYLQITTFFPDKLQTSDNTLQPISFILDQSQLKRFWVGTNATDNRCHLVIKHNNFVKNSVTLGQI